MGIYNSKIRAHKSRCQSPIAMNELDISLIIKEKLSLCIFIHERITKAMNPSVYLLFWCLATVC